MSYSLPNVTAPDEYTEDQAYLRCQGGVRLRISVSNQSVYYQRGTGMVGGNVGNWQPEEELIPGIYSLTDPCDALRFRAVIRKEDLPAGKLPAQLNVSVRTAAELTNG